MEFEEAMARWLEDHRRRRDGEAQLRLRNLGHAETTFLRRVWWPAFASFDYLHPEYEIRDYRDGLRYIDFAYIRGGLRVAIEIDGFSAHHRDLNSAQFAAQCQRQNHLVIDGWDVLRFAYIDVESHPRVCQQTLQQLLGRSIGVADLADLSWRERGVVMLVWSSARPVTPQAIADLLDVKPDAARELLRSLIARKWLQPATGTRRIRTYTLHPSRAHLRGTALRAALLHPTHADRRSGRS